MYICTKFIILYLQAIFVRNYMNKINYIIDEIADQYMLDDNNRPWIIGFSGGKDSTVLLTLT